MRLPGSAYDEGAVASIQYYLGEDFKLALRPGIFLPQALTLATGEERFARCYVFQGVTRRKRRTPSTPRQRPEKAKRP